MKTIAKTLVAISILMISLQVIAGNPTAFSTVHYKVLTHLQTVPQIPGMNIYVVITDGNNKMVTSPQLLRTGKNSYDFYESEGTFGTRVAQLILPEGYPTEILQYVPDARSGKFIPGHEYQFNLFIKIQKLGEVDE